MKNGLKQHPAALISYSGDVTQAKGYQLIGFEKGPDHFEGDLELIGPASNVYGIDVANLKVKVEYRSTHELRVHIYDRDKQQYQIPDSLQYGLPSRIGSPDDCALQFHHQAEPFAFWISRSTGEIIFDTRPAQIPVHIEPLCLNNFPIRDSTTPAYPLIFSDQYLQIASVLPNETNIYGLGDVMATSGFRRDNHGTIQGFWNGDPAGNPTDRNLYGTHAFYLEARPGDGGRSHGVYLRNSHGMDVILRTGVIEYRCLGGTLDLTFVAGPTPHDVVKQYSLVVGTPAQLPFWSFGFQLCSIDHKTLTETEEAVNRMAKAGIPLEVMWNDFYYMDRKRNFSLSSDFPPDRFAAFIDTLHSRSQRYVPLLDAGMYKPSNEDEIYEPYWTGHDADVYLKTENGSEYEGLVWGGKTVWPDWTHPKTAKWWSDCIEQFREKVNFDGLWLDMNEPSNLPAATDNWLATKRVVVVDGKIWVDLGQNPWDYPPYAIHNGWKSLNDLTVAPSLVTADGWRHYHQHNLYSLQEVKLTRDILERLEPNKRPFIVSRGTFAGQGSLSAHWLGDNYSTWDSLRKTIQGVLQHQLFQMPMVGADVGGFGGKATEELVNRWMSMGAFLPFYRNHNADAPQEPYLWQSVTEASKRAIEIRYRLLPYWESLFAKANKDGSVPIRPLFFEFEDPELYDVDLQFMIGPALLVTPCVHEGTSSVTGRFPQSGGTVWRDWYTHKVVHDTRGGPLKVPAPMGHIPLHVRSGTAILLHTRGCDTLTATRKSPFELLVSLSEDRTAFAEFLLDDGLNIKGEQTLLTVNAKGDTVNLSGTGGYQIPQRLERITVLGVTSRPDRVTVNRAPIAFEYDAEVQGISAQGMTIALNNNASIRWL